MITAIYLEIKRFILDFDSIYEAIWKNVLLKVTNKSPVSEKKIKEIIILLNNAIVANDYQDILKKYYNLDFNDVSYTSIIQNFNESLIQYIEQNSSKLVLNLKFLNHIAELVQKHEITCYLINDTFFSDLLIKSLNLIKNYPFFEVIWKKEKQKPTQIFWIDETLLNWENPNIVLDILVDTYKNKDEIVWFIEEPKIFNSIKKLNIFSVTSTNNKKISGNYSFDPKEYFNFEEILYLLFNTDEEKQKE